MDRDTAAASYLKPEESLVPMVLRRRTAIRRHAARLTLIFLLISLALGMPPATQVAEAAEQPELSVSKTAADTVLAGEELPYEIRVTSIGVDGYNLSVRDHLPPGVTYVSGTSPRQFGEPQIIAVPGDETTQDSQILIWSNISDLPASGTQVLRFSVRADEAVYPVGSVVTNGAQAFLSENERVVPRFDAQGAPDHHDDVISADTATTAQTRINPVKIEKSEPSPEHELMRGVHDQSTVYTLTVTNNQVAATESIVVTDYLPAQLEFLGCGGVSNGDPEYEGRTVADTPAVDGCIEPISIETVQLGAGEVEGIERAGIYTKVVWEISNLDVGEKTEIKYAAGIPQRANTLFNGEAPTPGSLEQAANLNNNTGASTRELAGAAGSEGAQLLRNYATVEGLYTGPVVEE